MTTERSKTAKDKAELAQWLGRKFRNHQPMSKSDAAKGSGRTAVRGARTIGLVAGTEDELVYALKDGRRFKITLEEIPEGEPEIDTVPLKA